MTNAIEQYLLSRPVDPARPFPHQHWTERDGLTTTQSCGEYLAGLANVVYLEMRRLNDGYEVNPPDHVEAVRHLEEAVTSLTLAVRLLR